MSEYITYSVIPPMRLAPSPKEAFDPMPDDEIKTAGPYKTVDGADQYVLRIAIMTHETNRAWCKLNGDESQPAWNDAPDWQRQSAVDGVHFHLHNPRADDEASHNNWLRTKREAGWTWGLRKDELAKTHPCMVPFSRLPWDQQAKDALFRHVVQALAYYTPAGAR